MRLFGMLKGDLAEILELTFEAHKRSTQDVK
jgi:hypothetical protein